MSTSSLLYKLRTSKLLLLLGLYAAVLLVPSYIVTLAGPWLKRALADLWWVVPIGLFGVLASLAPIVYITVLRRIEGRLLRDQRRYHRTLIAASSGMTRIKELKQLCRLIVYMVNRTVGLTNATLFLYDNKEQRYALKAARYPSLVPADLSIDQHDPLVAVLQEEKDIIVIDELQSEIDTKRPDDWAKKAAWIYSWMRKQEARLIVPNFSGTRLLAFLVLGAKRAGGGYTTDDIAMFSALANQAALAIENALFFEELRLNESYIIQSEKLASLGQLASGMAHEIHNPLTIISGEAQLYLEQFKGKDGQVDQVLRSIIEECQRAADITRRILRFAKPAPSDLVPVSLKSIVDETLTLAGYQVRLDRVERVVKVPEMLPKVKGNQNQLQEVFLNLVLNACQAMGEKGGKIVFAGVEQEGDVVLKVTDNGPGIPAASLRKVFDPFYTTKANGTGLGLFVCQRIIKSHGGSMTVDSAEGQGTCFTVRLPAVAREDTPAQELAKTQ